jgi:hypothetical protein
VVQMECHRNQTRSHGASMLCGARDPGQALWLEPGPINWAGTELGIWAGIQAKDNCLLQCLQ